MNLFFISSYAVGSLSEFVFGRSVDVELVGHAAVKQLLGLPASGQVLVLIVQTRPVLRELLVATALDLLKELLGAVGHLLALLQALSGVLGAHATYHERVVCVSAVAAVMVCSPHQHC